MTQSEVWDEILHALYETGEVVLVEADDDRTMITVHFANGVWYQIRVEQKTK